MTLHVQNFLKTLDKIKYSKSRYEIFNDWLVLASAALYTWKNDKRIEEEYLQVSKQYKKEELELHTELLKITTDALTEKEQDFLGEVFTFGELTNNKRGQFFTPYHISYMMAEMIIGENETPQKQIIKVLEPCCGAGGMIIACASVMKDRGINFQRDAFFTGIDIDARCVQMAFIQCSLLGIPAIIVCGNSLTLETYWQRETIGYVISGMNFRIKAEELFNKIKNPEKKVISKPNQITIKLPPSRELVQRELF